jgi:pyrroline-5-carboxylate reductase
MLRECAIGFIGAGAMAEAILEGLLKRREITSSQVSMVNRGDRDRMSTLVKRYGLEAAKQTIDHVALADVVILAVKPKDAEEALTFWQNRLRPGQLLISVVAGITTQTIEEFVHNRVAVVRAMPNTSCAVGLSATALCGGRAVTEQQFAMAERIFMSVGSVVRVDESAMDAVTGLSGSGPAYIYYMAEALQTAGMHAGLPAETARQLTVQTLLGAAHMLMESGKEAEQLRREVTSPGGTTMAGLEVLRRFDVAEAMKMAVLRAKERAGEMGKRGGC